jgi:hypothetical protein
MKGVPVSILFARDAVLNIQKDYRDVSGLSIRINEHYVIDIK